MDLETVQMEPAEQAGPSNSENDVFSYDDVFPALPESEQTGQGNSMGKWNQKMKVTTSVITQVFRVPVEERRFRDEDQFGSQGEQAKTCADIMQKTGSHIEISLAKDQSLTILMSGKLNSVLDARRRIVQELQTPASITMDIPKEHHRFILGKSGKKLKDLELNSATRISVPRLDDNSNMIKITGSKEGIDRARHEIQILSDEQSKLASERISIPKIYHPFIMGAHSENINQLMQDTGVRINIPPPSIQSEEISIAGEKEGVVKAKQAILKIYEEKKRKCQQVSVEVRKSQHKYVIGTRGTALQDILAQTGVSVEIPPADSPSETITLRGEQQKLGEALTMVYTKANSVVQAEVQAPSWLHRFIIGKKGANLREITHDLGKVHIQFNGDKITIEGPREDVDSAQEELENRTKDLLSRLTYEEIPVNPKYHKHIIGKSGVNVNRIKEETGVTIHIPSDNENSNVIRIEGTAEGVVRAKEELMEMVKKMENEKSRDINIEQRFHRSIIGAKGEKIKEIRDKFNQVNITFPEPGNKSDAVTIRGPQKDVDACYKHFEKLNKELVDSNHRIEVPIFKQFHKYIIGKGGATIKKIREETGTKIDLPAEGTDSDVIYITGKQTSVVAAKEKILTIQNELANIVSVDIIIPSKFHNSIIGSRGALIQSIMDECGGVSIHFPTSGSGSDKVTIRGPKEDVEKAKKQLVELTNEKQLTSYTVEIRAQSRHHKFLIGRNGVSIKKIREKTGARIIFPSDKDEDKELIIIIGRKEGVIEAKEELEKTIKELDKIVEGTMNVDPKHHRHFVARRGQILHDISEVHGGVTISFPRSNDNSSVVVLKGANEYVEAAKIRILEIVEELDKMITIECVIPQKYHRSVMGARGYRLQDITNRIDVQIKFPEREQINYSDSPDMNGEVPVPPPQENGNDVNGEGENTDYDKPKKSDIIRITGIPENCEKAKEALLALVPVTEEVNVPFEYHRFIIGKSGGFVRDMMNQCDVSIAVPQASEQSDTIKVTGPISNVKDAIQCLLDKVDELDRDKQDRVLRSFKIEVEVDAKYHSTIIGRKGMVINKIRDEHKVTIQFPNKPAGEGGDSQLTYNPNLITITGYEKNCETAREAILAFVKEREEMIKEEVEIDRRVHSRIIGAKGRNVRKIMEEFHVDIRFLGTPELNPNTVTISGSTEDSVLDARDHLLNLEEEYLQDLTDNEYLHPPRQYQDGDGNNSGDPKGFIVTGAPWQHKGAPDTSSSSEFPSFSGSGLTPGGGGGSGGGNTSKPVFWGPKR